ncbi:hypothetical protein [Moraxella sp.]|uniref:hypothetical protein n=1 Tax=Moraxella sp. TaxID=479 RepID=UPI0026DC96B1|nr:hypothetical protein [Moraxella sp.]MDO4894992.1 hypothetical protein [Moraxella sp.]
MASHKAKIILVASASPFEELILASRIVAHFNAKGVESRKLYAGGGPINGSIALFNRNKVKLIVLYGIKLFAGQTTDDRQMRWKDDKIPELCLMLYTSPSIYQQRNVENESKLYIANDMIPMYDKIRPAFWSCRKYCRINSIDHPHGLLLSCGKAVQIVDKLLKNNFDSI